MPEDNQPLESDSPLYDYLAGFGAKGIPLAIAKQSLRGNGWTEAEINSALRHQPYAGPIGPVLSDEATPQAAVFTEAPASSSSRTVRMILIFSVILLCAVGVFSLIRSSLAPSPQASGTITTTNCLKESGTISGGLSLKTCHIGSVQLTIIDR